jgi:galactose mutarotase-like enzyme
MPPSEPLASDAVRLSDADGEAVVALTGGQPTAWRVGGRDLLWSGDEAHWGWHAPVLFPVVGQVNGGIVRIDGKPYEMPRHGFARLSRFRLIEVSENTLTLRLEAGAETSSFPRPYCLDLTVRLHARSLSLAFEVSNPGEEILPYALGFHPAFPWPFDGGPQRSYCVEFEAPERSEVPMITSDGLIGRGYRSIPLRDRRLPLAPELFRADALVFPDARSRALRFLAPSGAGITMRLVNFPHLAVWTKPGAPFLSLEAWTGHADPEGFGGELIDKPSMVLLPPGSRRHHGVELSFDSA